MGNWQLAFDIELHPGQVARGTEEKRHFRYGSSTTCVLHAAGSAFPSDNNQRTLHVYTQHRVA